MKMNPPTKVVFYISVVLVVLGILGTFITIPFVSGLAFWFVVVGYALLAASLFVKGM